MAKNRLRWMALWTALMLLAAACAGTTPEDDGAAEGGEDGGTITLAIGGAEAAPGATHHLAIDVWNQSEEAPCQAEIERLPDAADEQRQQIALQAQSQSPDFDVYGMDVIWTGEFSQNGWVESLEDVRGEIEEVTLPGPFQSATWGGELWAAPYNSNAGFLYYRTDLIDEPPTTWEELEEMAMAAAEEAGIEPYVGQGARYEGMVVNYLEYLWGAGGGLLSEDGDEVVYATDDAAQTALEFMRSAQEGGLYAAGFNTMMEEEARNEFQSGNAVFMRNWPYAYNLMSGEDEENPSQVEGDFGIAPLPTFTGEGTVSALGGFNLGVSAYTDNMECAKQFVTFMATNEEVQLLLAERSLPPVLASAYESEELQEDPVMSLLGEVLPDSLPRPPAPTWNEISQEIQAQVFPAYTGQKQVDAAVSDLQAFLEETVAE